MPASAYSTPSFRSQLAGAVAGRPARGSFLVFNPDLNAGNILAVDGSLLTDGWATGSAISVLDPTPPVAAPQSASSSAGGMVAVWQDIDGTVRADIRKTTFALWQAPQTLDPASAARNATCTALTFGGPVWLCAKMAVPAINARGHAVVLYTEDAANGTAPLFVATNQNPNVSSRG